MPSTFPQGQAETDSCLENWVNKIASGGPKICFGSLPRAQSPPARIRADSQHGVRGGSLAWTHGSQGC